jgi:hypothetical protein
MRVRVGERALADEEYMSAQKRHDESAADLRCHTDIVSMGKGRCVWHVRWSMYRQTVREREAV